MDYSALQSCRDSHCPSYDQVVTWLEESDRASKVPFSEVVTRLAALPPADKAHVPTNRAFKGARVSEAGGSKGRSRRCCPHSEGRSSGEPPKFSCLCLLCAYTAAALRLLPTFTKGAAL